MSSTVSLATQQLDLLQTEVNRVLEQVGRVFAATNGGTKTSSTAQVTRLRQILPGSISRFHDALDDIEDQLQTAQLVTRRDFSRWRSQTGHTVDLRSDHILAKVTDQIPRPLDEDVQMSDAKADITHDGPDNNIMPDMKPDSEVTDITAQTQTRNHTHEASPPADAKTQEPSGTVDEATDSKRGTSLTQHATLHIDTTAEREATESNATAPPIDEDTAPDTGTFSNNADLDSLFNDPISAGGSRDDQAAPTDFDPHDDFDFGAFNASLGEHAHDPHDDNDTDHPHDDNDNIDALIPGLQDYANHTQSEHEPDYAALFGGSSGGDGGAGGEGDADPTVSVENGEHRPPHDSTFDDLMDFADFNAGDWMPNEGQADEG